MDKSFYLLIIEVALLVSCSNKQNQGIHDETDKAILVKTENIQDFAFKTTLEYSGEIEPVLSVPLSFQLPGTVSKIYVDEGDPVKKGQILSVLDKTSYQSSYDAAVAKQTQAQDAYNRLKKVHDNGSLPDIKWEEAKANLEQAVSTAKIAKKNLDNCTIISPLSGFIGMRKLEIGSTTTPGITVFNIISVEKIYARISVPENEINKIKKGLVASVTFPALGEATFSGTVEKIDVEANNISKTYEVKLLMNNKNLEIKPGMVCNINLSISQEETGLLVPVKAVMEDENHNNYVFIADTQSNTAKRQEVKTGGIINNRLSILSGLNPGETLIIEGQQKLLDGNKIRVE